MTNANPSRAPGVIARGLRSYWPAKPGAEILSGLTVAIALVPEAVAFAFVAGVDPIIGLYSAFMIGLITSIFGGRPGMISGATGAMAVVVVALVATHGVVYLFPTVILCGVLQIVVGLLHLGKFIRMVPYSVMLGFVNGLAIVIALAQIPSFKQIGPDGLLHFLTGTQLALMIGGVLLTMAIIEFLPKLTKAVPSSLAAILIVSGLAIAANATFDGAPFMTVKDMLAEGQQHAAVRQVARESAHERAALLESLAIDAGLASESGSPAAPAVLSAHDTTEAIERLPQAAIDRAIASVDVDETEISGGLPVPYFLDGAYEGLLPPLSFATLAIIFPFALILAGVGLIESLMTLTLIDEITETRGRGNRECVGQGVANVTCGVFGGMGGCAMIGQSLINVNSGGRNRLSGVTAALCLLAFILFLGRWIGMIPMAALVGVMFMVVIGTFEWTSLRTFRKIPLADVLVMLTVTVVTVLAHDLATAVFVGVIISALIFAWQHATHIFADEKYNEHGSKLYQLHGPLFFASVASFQELFTPADDPEDVVIDFYYTRVYDQSGLQAINTLADRYRKFGRTLHLRHLSDECKSLLDKAGDVVEVNISEDPHYHVATDRLA
ncbi:MAG: SulP family inorganic anion transporter [Phycisphaerales bacterium]